MTKEELIAKQQLQIEDLLEANRGLRESIEEASRHFVCIGAPLNDNILQFNSDQIKWALNVNSILEDAL